MAPLQIPEPMKDRVFNDILAAYTGMNGTILLWSSELEQKLMWGSTRDTRIGAIQAVQLETGLFVKPMKITELITLRGPKLKLSIEIELTDRHE